MDKLSVFKRSVAAGVMISIGAIVKMQCKDPVVGSVLFSIGLFFICAFGLYLFTGKIAYIDKSNWHDYPVIWSGNFLGCIFAAVLIRIAKPGIAPAAREIMAQKLDLNLFAAAALAFFCGILMFLAVDNYRTADSGVSKVFGVVIGVTVFLLCGFEHSIADMAYASFAANDVMLALRSVGFILLVSVFNGLGSLAFKFMLKTIRKTTKNQT